MHKFAVILGIVFVSSMPAYAQNAEPSTVELYNRVLQSGAALGAGIRSMSNDVAALVNSMQKESTIHVDQLTWWNACAKRADCLDWLKLGIGHD